MITAVLVLFPFLSLQGCMENRAETEKKILAYDPSFRKSLDRRNELLKDLNFRQTSFMKSEQLIEDEINALKQKKTQEQKEYLSSVEKIERQIDPEKRNLRQDLAGMQRYYKRKKGELKDVDRDIKEINALVKKKDRLVLTPEEVRVWNERLSSLVKKKAETSSDVAKVKEEIEITKLKIKVLSLE